MVDGEVNSPATATPTRFHLNPSDSGREICKEAIFSPVRRLPAKKYVPRGVHAAAADFNISLIVSKFRFFRRNTSSTG